MTMADRIGILSQGELVQVGTPREIYETPANLYVAARLGQPQINILPANLLPAEGAPAQAAQVGARTEHIALQKAANGAANGRIDWIEHLGDQNHVHLTCGGRKIVCLSDPASGLGPGDDVAVKLVNPLYFDASGARIA